MAAADLTGDGKLDIITTNYGSDTVSVLLNNGDGSFLNQQTFATDLEPVLAVVADVNGDGRPDLVTASNHDSAIGVLLGKGDGTFEPAPAGSGVGLADTPFLADFTGNGIADSVVLDRSGDILFRAGIAGAAGTFAPPVVLNPGRPARAIAVLRIGSQFAVAAADTHFDPTLSTNQFIFTVSIYTVSASGEVSRRTAFATTALPTSLAAADLTGNGLDDLIAANALDNSVTIALQTSPGQFAAPMTVPAGVAPSDIAVADLNGDGLPDIIVSDQASGDVTVLAQRSRAHFQPVAALPRRHGPVRPGYDRGQSGRQLVRTDGQPGGGRLSPAMARRYRRRQSRHAQLHAAGRRRQRRLRQPAAWARHIDQRRYEHQRTPRCDRGGRLQPRRQRGSGRSDGGHRRALDLFRERQRHLPPHVQHSRGR